MQKVPLARRGVRAVVIATTLLVTATGCSWFGGDDEPATTATPAPVAEVAVPVEVLGVDADRVEVGAPRPAPETGQGYYFVSQLWPVSGPELEQPVLVRMALDSALPEGTPLTVAARADDEAPWRFVEGRLDAEGSHVEFIVPELATFGVLAVDAGSVERRLGDAVDAALDDDATAPQVDGPGCADPEAAREDGYVAKSWRRTTVAWCLDRVGEERVLRLTNTRGVPVRLDAPGAVERGTTGDPVRPGVAWDAWTSAVASADLADPATATDSTAGTDSTSTVVAPGQTLEVDADLEPGSSLLVTASDDPRSRSVQVLRGAALGLAAQVVETGLTTGARPPRGERVLRRLLETPACAEALGQAPRALARACLGPRALTRALGDAAGLLRPVLTTPVATALVRSRTRALAAGADRVEQRLEVSRDLPDFGALVGRFTGTGRSVVVTADGLVTESWGTAAGSVMTVGYQLSDPEPSDPGAAAGATATATVTSVQVVDRAAARGRAPRVGQSGVIVLGADGVLRTPFVGATYCTSAAAAADRCTDAPVAQPTPTRAPATAGATRPPRQRPTEETTRPRGAPAPTTGPAAGAP